MRAFSYDVTIGFGKLSEPPYIIAHVRTMSRTLPIDRSLTGLSRDVTQLSRDASNSSRDVAHFLHNTVITNFETNGLPYSTHLALPW